MCVDICPRKYLRILVLSYLDPSSIGRSVAWFACMYVTNLQRRSMQVDHHILRGGRAGIGYVALVDMISPSMMMMEAYDAVVLGCRCGGVVVDGAVVGAEGADVVVEGSLVLEVGAARAEPTLAAVLLVRAPVALDGEGLGA